VFPGRHKVVFFHHGLCASRTDTTAINEQLASRGEQAESMQSRGRSASRGLD
jgi:hypothetical protein